MRSKLFVLFFFVVGCVNVFGQVNYRYIPLIISIDGDIPETEFTHERFLIKDSAGKITDSIPFKYRVSKAKVSDEGYQKIFSLDKRSKLVIKFEFDRSAAYGHAVGEEVYNYEKTINHNFINDVYLILKVINCSNPINYNFPDLKNGYGIEVYAPGSGSIIGVKKIIPYKPLKKYIFPGKK